MMRTFIVLGAGLTLGLVASHGCAYRELDLTHCAHNDGDASCAERFPDGSRPFCQRGTDECYTPNTEFGCVAAENKPADECYSPCGGRSSIDENGACVVVEDSSTGTSSGTETGDTESSDTGESSSTTGPMPCMSDDECTNPEAPFCGTAGECGTCDGTTDPDAACAGVDPLLPLCVGSECVACTPENPIVCDDQLLLCDGTTNACVPCTEHAQCGSGACELAVGRCFPEDFVVRVDGDAGAMPMPDYTSIAAAVAAVDDGAHGVIIVHELDGSGSYQTAGMGLLIDGGKTIALLAAPGEAPIIQGTGSNPGLAVQGVGTILYTDGLRVAQGTGLGLRVTEGFAWLDRSRIVGNDGGGVLAETSAQLTLRNCFVGQDATGQVAIAVNASNAILVSNTVLGGFGMNTIALQCTGGGAVDVRNSVFATLSPTAEITCPGAVISFSAAETNPGGEGSIALGAVDETIMGGLFLSYGTGDYHLAAEGVTTFADVAHWTLGDPLTDIDGEPRPAVDGTADFAGADVPQ
jgi:hypothetical protein